MMTHLLAIFFASSIYFSSGTDIGHLGKANEQTYGSDSFCWVSIRPLYAGEEEGLPLYEIFDQENTELTGYEFRRLYNTELPHALSKCQCPEPLDYAYAGFTIALTERQKFEFDLYKGLWE